MFKHLILDILSEGPKSTREQYAVAKKRQPRNCDDAPCPHRETPSESDQERKYELRRNQHQLKREGRTASKDGMWRLV